MPTPAYFPDHGDRWERCSPEQVGMDSDRLADAVAFTEAHETPMPRDLRRAIEDLTRQEGQYGAIVGPVRSPRGGVNGLVLRHGYIVAEWGNTTRVDMTFSVSKSYLATLAGLALDRGLIRNLDDPVREYVDDGGFDPRHNNKITWRHLLQLTSEWQGTLWGKPDSVDHNRVTGSDPVETSKGNPRQRREPGSYFEYNDVRVNRLSLALLRVWGRPLPEVFKESIMDSIDASETWEWHGYENSYVEIGGRRVQSVSGGGHWGGGVWVSSRDHARFGYLHLRRGRWRERQLVSEQWVETATTPSAVNPGYGCLWWLNTGRIAYPSAPASSYFALGWGRNAIWVDPEHDLVAVVRWIDPTALDGFIARVLSAVTG
ncbi:MAG: beta-lactamase family protein [Chloroflexota bacterium]|nr:beta-lactamase family protein [Chloroflexota bacterium]